MAKHTDYLKKMVDILYDSTISNKNNEKLDWEYGFEEVVQMFADTKEKDGHLFFVGNGGSAAIAEHMTADFIKNGRMKTVSIVGNALTTCMSNDYGYEYAFSNPLEMLMKEGDMLVAISSSGNSKSIVNAINVAREKRSSVVTLSGFRKDNVISSMGDMNIYVPIEHYGIVESIHNLLLQQVVDELMEK